MLLAEPPSKETAREARRVHADPRSQDPSRLRPEGRGHGLRLPVAVAATSTSRIKLGTNIATVFSRSPMITAHIAWDLQKASAGRFTLGLGTQVKAHNERRFSVKFESPGPKMAEAIRAIRTIWD